MLIAGARGENIGLPRVTQQQPREFPLKFQDHPETRASPGSGSLVELSRVNLSAQEREDIELPDERKKERAREMRGECISPLARGT